MNNTEKPICYIYIGIPCSGKSTFAKKQGLPILSCDKIRGEFSGYNKYVFDLQTVQYVKGFSLKLGTEATGRMGKQGFFLSHYSHQVWSQSHHGVIHLFGHSHGSLPGIGRSMDVGVDTHNLYPYHLDEILEIMKKIPVEIIDHHNSSTN